MGRLGFVFFALVALLCARLFGGPMDGTRWDVKIAPQSLFSLSHSGTLVFRRGHLSVLAPMSAGLSPGYYNAQAVDGTTTDAVWNASLTGQGGDVVAWHGLVRGDRIEGFAVWWDKSGRSRRFTFKGSRSEG